ILFVPSCVVKSFPKALFQQAKCHVEVVYTVLEEHAIPNPRGQERKSANLDELFHVLTNVLEALVKLHAAFWMHRDIRWSNIIKSRDDNISRFLIDFMDAARIQKIHQTATT
ncbi:hypothetical protein THRCLA_23056, partial [Thraustotheca clavata]